MDNEAWACMGSLGPGGAVYLLSGGDGKKGADYSMQSACEFEALDEPQPTAGFHGGWRPFGLGGGRFRLLGETDDWA